MRFLNKKMRYIFLPLASVVVWAAQSAFGSDLESCGNNENLFQDPSFTQIDDQTGGWIYSQHTGNRSFDISASDGELEIRRIDQEPWMIFYHTVIDPSLSGVTVHFSAELSGDAPAQPRIHGFPHKAGLYLKVGNQRNAIVADHAPNSGKWDWQAISVKKAVPEGVTELRVGFVHQSGGVLRVRNPALTYTDCSTKVN